MASTSLLSEVWSTTGWAVTAEVVDVVVVGAIFGSGFVSLDQQDLQFVGVPDTVYNAGSTIGTQT